MTSITPAAGTIPGRATQDGSRYDVSRWTGHLDPRRTLQIALGLIWLLDAALQYQPYMFSRAFVTGIIEPTAQGNPGPIAHPITWSAHLMAHHIVVFNAAFATVQLVIAMGLFYRRTVKAALVLSVVWALAVWWFGEGLGGVLTGATPLMGAPGAVVLYAFLAVALWPKPTNPVPSVAESGPLGSFGAGAAWVALWVSMEYLFLLPANRAASAAHDAIAGMADGEPGPIAALDHHLANFFAGNGLAVALTFSLAFAAIGASVLLPTSPVAITARRAAIVLAILVGLAIWTAENFGGILTGQGTDPNSGLLLVLVAAAYWSRQEHPAHSADATIS